MTPERITRVVQWLSKRVIDFEPVSSHVSETSGELIVSCRVHVRKRWKLALYLFGCYVRLDARVRLMVLPWL